MLTYRLVSVKQHNVLADKCSAQNDGNYMMELLFR